MQGFAALIGKNGRLVGRQRHAQPGDRFTEATHVAYTPCKICNQPGQRTPVWRVEANRVVYDQFKHSIMFKGATLEFLGVPIFYTPYLTEPDPTVHYASAAS